MISRRTFSGALLGGLAFAEPRTSSALGRTPRGGRLTFSVPWSLARIDPHDPLDGASALFAPAVADPLYALDAKDQVYPALADGVPERRGAGTLVRLRPGLVTGRGASLDAGDVLHSIERARRFGSRARLASLGRLERVPGDPLGVFVPTSDPDRVARALASPLVALVPRGFDPRKPDGTGAFVARFGPGTLRLEQNLRAARGPAFLEALEVRAAPDLRASLRAFESGHDDLGWLGAGLHGQLRASRSFDLGAAALVVLVGHRELGALGRPGALQALCDAIPRDRLAHLGLGELPPGGGSWERDARPLELVVDAASPHLVEIADAVASAVGASGTPTTVARVGASELSERRRRPGRDLFLQVLRPHAWSSTELAASLTALDDPARAEELGRAPRKGLPASPRALTATLRVGVLGELRVLGAALPELRLAAASEGGWDLGASYRLARG